MGHAHAHAHGEGEGNFFLDQLFTILTCGAVGLVAVLMYTTGMLSRILVPMFFGPVLAGGVAILVLVAVRAVAVWQLAGARRAVLARAEEHAHEHEHSHAGSGHSHDHDDENCSHDHAHSHGEECGHDHAHSHGDGHDHGWAPWRYMVLAIPVFLYFLDLPRPGGRSIPEGKGSSQLTQAPQRQALAALAGGPVLTKALRKTEPRRLTLKFNELSEAAAVPSRHEIYEGDIGVIRGQYNPLVKSDGRDFTLFRWKMTCCSADAVPMETRIEAPMPVQGIQKDQWIQVEGLISFQKDEKGKWVAVLTLKSNDDISFAEPTTDSTGF